MPTLLLDSPRTTQRNVGGAGGLIASRGNYIRHYRIVSNFHEEKFLQFVFTQIVSITSCHFLLVSGTGPDSATSFRVVLRILRRLPLKD